MGLLIALEYLEYVVSSSQLFSRDLAILENPLYVYKYLSVYGKSFGYIHGIFRIYYFNLRMYSVQSTTAQTFKEAIL